MPGDFTYMFKLKNKSSKQAEQKHIHRYREHFDSCQMGDSWGDGIKK